MKTKQIIFIILCSIAIFRCQSFSADTVYDHANLFSEDNVAWLSSYHQKLLEEYDIDYRVMTINKSYHAGNLELFTNKMFREIKAGNLSKSGKGLLLVIDADNDKVRIEVSAALEAVYTDSFIAYIQTRQMVPFFTSERIVDGILATTELIFARAQQASQNKEFMPPTDAFSSGGGAQTDARIGAGSKNNPEYQSKITDISEEKIKSLTPTQVVALYIQAMQNRDARPDLSIYSRQSRDVLKQWTMTPAQMDNISRTMKSCTQDAERILLKLAVVRYNVEQRQCSPYFLIFEEGVWRLDFATMQSLIKFNHNNLWHFTPQTYNPYGFAFGDWRFDENKYPYPRNNIKFRWEITYNTMYDGNLYITYVGKDSPAEKFGFKYGDQIISWMGQENFDSDNIIHLMNRSKPGEKIRATVISQPLKTT